METYFFLYFCTVHPLWVVFLGIACAASAFKRSHSTQFYWTLFHSTRFYTVRLWRVTSWHPNGVLWCVNSVLWRKRACYDLPEKNFYGRQTVCYGELRQQRAMAKQRTKTYQQRALAWTTALYYVPLRADGICYGCGARRPRTSPLAIASW